MPDGRLTELDSITTPQVDDVIYVVSNSLSKKLSIDNLASKLPAMHTTGNISVSGDISIPLNSQILYDGSDYADTYVFDRLTTLFVAETGASLSAISVHTTSNVGVSGQLNVVGSLSSNALYVAVGDENHDSIGIGTTTPIRLLHIDTGGVTQTTETSAVSTWNLNHPLLIRNTTGDSIISLLSKEDKTTGINFGYGDGIEERTHDVPMERSTVGSIIYNHSLSTFNVDTNGRTRVVVSGDDLTGTLSARDDLACGQTFRLSGEGHIVGTLSALSEARIAGNVFVDDDTLVVDSSNDRIGINIKLPEFALDVSDDARVRGTSPTFIIEDTAADEHTNRTVLLGDGDNVKIQTKSSSDQLVSDDIVITKDLSGARLQQFNIGSNTVLELSSSYADVKTDLVVTNGHTFLSGGLTLSGGSSSGSSTIHDGLTINGGITLPGASFITLSGSQASGYPSTDYNITSADGNTIKTLSGGSVNPAAIHDKIYVNIIRGGNYEGFNTSVIQTGDAKLVLSAHDDTIVLNTLYGALTSVGKYSKIDILYIGNIAGKRHYTVTGDLSAPFTPLNVYNA